MKTAIVHDWFAGYAGSEKVVESLTNIWRSADIFCLFDFLSESDRKIILKDKKPYTSFIQNLPFARNNHRNYLPLFPYAVEQFDLSSYDLIISSSHAVAKGVLTNSNQLHICYCHTPIRYAWDLMHQYLNEAGLKSGIKSFIVRSVLHYLRMWDKSTASRPDYIIANSNYIRSRISKIYNREADVIYPPVDVSAFNCSSEKGDYYITASRLVSYKRVDLMVQAFNSLPDKRLIVAGSGPDLKKLKKTASSNITFTGYLSTASLNQHLRRAKAFIFAADEDFGIAPIEALACGTPVIALNKGGTAETIVNGRYGILFQEQSSYDIAEAIRKFEAGQTFSSSDLRSYSEQFSRAVFEKKIKEYVDRKTEEFFTRK